MRRALLACLGVLAAAVPAAHAAIPAPPRASLEGFVCERASDALDRVIAVTGVMGPMSGTRREMRFVLQRHLAGASSFTPVEGGDLGHWLVPPHSLLPTAAWGLKKVVANLAGPATYRLRVTFRWQDASGVLLDRTTLTSAVCAAQ